MRTRVALGTLALLTAAGAVLAFFLLRYPMAGFRTPIGADASVYVWWANTGQVDGLSVANWRPGVPALILVLSSILDRTPMEIVAGLGAVLAATSGLAGAAIVRADERARAHWVAVVAVVLTGMYAGHLADGYLSNLAFAAAFLAVVALLASEAPVWAGIAALGAAGLTHPMFLFVAVAILIVGAAMTRARGRAAILTVAAGGSAIMIGGLLWMLAGPRPLPVDSSADAFFRRAGLTELLRQQYRQRFRWQVGWYVAWLSVPLAFLGRGATKGKARHLLDAWLLVCAGGFAVSFAGGFLPPARWLAFAFALPVLGALGLWRLRSRVENPFLAWAAIALILGILLTQASGAWSRSQVASSPSGIATVRALGERLDAVPVGEPVVVVLPPRNATSVMNTGNLLRAYLPPERVDDVHLFLGSEADLRAGRALVTGDPEKDALAGTLLADLRRASIDPARVPVYVPEAAGSGEGPSPWSLVCTGVLMFVALLFAGLGWSLVVVRRTIAAVSLAPAAGLVVAILPGVAVDRLGLRLTGAVPVLALLVSVIVGYVLAWRTRGSRGSAEADP